MLHKFLIDYDEMKTLYNKIGDIIEKQNFN